MTDKNKTVVDNIKIDGSGKDSKDMPVREFCKAVREIVGGNLSIRAATINTQLDTGPNDEVLFHVDILGPDSGPVFASGATPEAVIEKLKDIFQ